MGDDSTTGDAIRLEGVTKRFASFVAVHEADFAIARGEFFSMLGPSGCGKTTTLRMIAGFETPTEGRILLEGTDVSRTPPYRRNVNTVFQQYALFPHLDVERNVSFGLESRKVPKAEIRQRVGEMLEIVRMEGFTKRKPAQLSGGQQQRVALARALVNKPAALLLDEPLAALDLKLRQAMQLELKRIQRDTGVTFVFVTHDQQEALTMSDRVAVMSGGWVEQIDTPERIYHEPSTAFVASYIWSGVGEVKTWPGQAASSMPKPTNPAWSGSCPDPPPEISATLPGVSLARRTNFRSSPRTTMSAWASVAAKISVLPGRPGSMCLTSSPHTAALNGTVMTLRLNSSTS